MTNSAIAFAQWEQLIASFGAVPDPGLYDGRRLFAVWIRQFPIPSGISVRVVTPNGLPCLCVEPDSFKGTDLTRTLMHVHGGAFASGNGSDFLALGARLALAAQARVVLAEYRLAPEHPYPCANDDCWSIYNGLLQDGVNPKQLALSGDSAGGGLGLSTLLRAKAAGCALPAAAAILSPWVDLSMSNTTWDTVDDPTASRESMQPYLDAYLGDQNPQDPDVSPFFADLSGLPPLLVQVGSREVFLGEATEIASRARAAGVDATLEIAEGMPHIWHFFASLLPEGQQAIDRVGKFVTHHL